MYSNVARQHSLSDGDTAEAARKGTACRHGQVARLVSGVAGGHQARICGTGSNSAQQRLQDRNACLLQHRPQRRSVSGLNSSVN